METFYRLQECEPGEERKLLATYRRLFHDAATRLPPGRSREELQEAIRIRAHQMKLARKRPRSMPPAA